MFMMLAGVVLSSPLSLLPCKDTVEELILGQTRTMSSTENSFCTFGLVTICCCFAIWLPNIGDAMVIVGSTSNPIVAFVLPLAYWLKIDKSPKYSLKRMLAVIFTVLICFVSLFSLFFFIKGKQTVPTIN
jgi:amino acid permease